MSISRKLPAFVLLASYLFAVTLAERFHNHGGACTHGDGCGHAQSVAAHQHPPTDAKGHRHSHSHHLVHHHGHHHDHKGAVNDDQPDPGQWHATAHCAVCDFLAQLPLPTAPADLVTCGRMPPQAVVFQDSQTSGWQRNTHLPRGPPTLS